MEGGVIMDGQFSGGNVVGVWKWEISADLNKVLVYYGIKWLIILFQR